LLQTLPGFSQCKTGFILFCLFLQKLKEKLRKGGGETSVTAFTLYRRGVFFSCLTIPKTSFLDQTCPSNPSIPVYSGIFNQIHDTFDYLLDKLTHGFMVIHTSFLSTAAKNNL
jgi:hypothetical protein